MAEPNNQNNANVAANPADQDLAKKLMEELKTQGVDVDALQKKSQENQGKDTAPAPVDKNPAPVAEVKQNPVAVNETTSNPVNPAPSKETGPNPTTSEAAETASNSESGDDLVKSEQEAEQEIHQTIEKAEYWNVKISKDIIIIAVIIFLIACTGIWLIFW